MRLTTRRAVLLALCSIALIVHSQVRGDLEIDGGACLKEATCGAGICHAGHVADESCASGQRCYVGKAGPKEALVFQSCRESPNPAMECHAGAKTEPEDPIVCPNMRAFHCACEAAPVPPSTAGTCDLTVAGCSCDGEEDVTYPTVTLQNILCFNE